MRMILAALSERAAADSRKCCHEDRPEKTKPLLFLPGSVAEYKPDFAGGGCYMIPDLAAQACWPSTSRWPLAQAETRCSGLRSCALSWVRRDVLPSMATISGPASVCGLVAHRPATHSVKQAVNNSPSMAFPVSCSSRHHS